MTAPASETRTNMLREGWMTALASETRTNMLRECWMTAPASETRTFVYGGWRISSSWDTSMCMSDYVSNSLTRKGNFVTSFWSNKPDPELFAPDLPGSGSFWASQHTKFVKKTSVFALLFIKTWWNVKNTHNTFHSSFEEQGQIHFELPEQRIFLTQSYICCNL